MFLCIFLERVEPFFKQDVVFKLALLSVELSAERLAFLIPFNCEIGKA